MTDEGRWIVAPNDALGSDWHKVTDTRPERTDAKRRKRPTVPTFLVRVGRGADGHLGIRQLLIGEDDPGDSEPRWITSDILRAIQTGAILEAIAERDAELRAALTPAGEWVGEPPEFVGGLGPSGLPRWMPDAIVVSDTAEPVATDGQRSRRGAVGPTEDELTRFAAAILRHRPNTRHEIARARRGWYGSRDLPRATANRWRAECERRGLLPPREDRGDD